MNLYEIKQKLARQERAVFTINEVARILRMKKLVASVYVSRMVKKGLVFRVERQKISLTDDPFIVASQLTYPSYISFTSALYLHNLFPQVIDRIYLATTVKKKSLKLFNTQIIFVNISPKFMFGYKKIKKENSFVMVADLEKAIIDCLAFPRYCRLSYLLPALRKVNIKKLQYYLAIIKKEGLNRRAGYLLDFLNIKHSIKRKNNVVYKLNPSIKKSGKFDKKWYIYVNEDLK
jgi:predicted transcriptional regulator of viral defense system